MKQLIIIYMLFGRLCLWIKGKFLWLSCKRL